MLVEPLVLVGDHVRLEPLSTDHLDALWALGQDPALWAWTTTVVRSRDDMARYVGEALAWQQAGTAVPFATVEQSGGTIVGSTRFANIAVEYKRVEIGWTWIAQPWQRTAVNTEAKYLMLRHAFEVWGVNRLELKTDVLNEKSRRAIQRIGAREVGILRRHMVTETGRLRDTVYYSIVREEWEEVGKRLRERLTSVA